MHCILRICKSAHAHVWISPNGEATKSVWSRFPQEDCTEVQHKQDIESRAGACGLCRHPRLRRTQRRPFRNSPRLAATAFGGCA
ncbi:uncharacterized [Tachysurus ichikawai]